MLIVPECSEDLVGEPYRVYELAPAPPVEGRRLRWRYAPMLAAPHLTYDETGVTYHDCHVQPTTIVCDSCVGVLAWQDGSRMLFAEDGTWLLLDAEEWNGFGKVRHLVDTRCNVPTGRIPGSPARDPEEPSLARRWAARQLFATWLPAAIGLVLVVLALYALSTAPPAPDPLES